MERKLSKVVVATDFSEIANAAIPYGYSIVEPGGEVHLIHIVEHQDVPSPMYSHYTSDELNIPAKRAELSAELEKAQGERRDIASSRRRGRSSIEAPGFG